jgi:hypothetical protein
MSQLSLFTPVVPLEQRLRVAGLPAETAITVHGNRRTLISISREGGLRVHQGYAAAPDTVVRAIVEWATARGPKSRRQASARLREFRFETSRTPVRRQVEPARPGDDVRIGRLEALWDELNRQFFDGALEPITMVLSSRMRRKLGHYEPKSAGAPRIVMSRRHLRRDGWDAVRDTLLHEMVHQWQDHCGHSVDHGRVFRAKARAVGIEPRAVTKVA